MLYDDCNNFEKPIDLILKAIENMDIKDKELGEGIDRLHKTLIEMLNKKIVLE